MSSLIVGDDAAILAALQENFRRAAEQGQVVMFVKPRSDTTSQESTQARN